jgi:flagellin
MPQTINTNLNSLNAQRNLNMSQSSLSVAMQRLSSGLRVNSAKDDAAGLAIAERMNAQVKGMNVAVRTTSDMTADASLTAVTTGVVIDSTSNTASLKTVIDAIDGALDRVNSERAVYGATQSRFDAIISNLQVSADNQTAARSRIMDADFAAETAALSRAQILQSAGNAMVAQANQLPQQVLKLLQG